MPSGIKNLFLFLFFISFALSPLTPLLPKEIKAADANLECRVELRIPTTVDISQGIKFNYTTTSIEGEVVWRGIWSISGPYGYQEGGIFDNSITGIGGAIYDVGKVKYNGEHILQIHATTGSGENIKSVTCQGSPLKFTTTGSTAQPPEIPVPPKIPDDELCSIVFGDGKQGTKNLVTGNSVTVKTAGPGNPTFGDKFVIKRNGVQIAESAGSATVTENLSMTGEFVYTAYHVVTGTPRIEHLCTAGDDSIKVIVASSQGLPGLSGPDVEGGSIDTPLGSIPTSPVGFATWFAKFAIGIVGGIAFLLMVFGSYRLIFAGGNPEAIQQGREVITAAIIGLIVVVFAVFILRLIGVSILGLPI